jgi:hypothetical protein
LEEAAARITADAETIRGLREQAQSFYMAYRMQADIDTKAAHVRAERAESARTAAQIVIEAARDIRSSVIADDIDIDIIGAFDAALAAYDAARRK